MKRYGGRSAWRNAVLEHLSYIPLTYNATNVFDIGMSYRVTAKPQAIRLSNACVCGNRFARSRQCPAPTINGVTPKVNYYCLQQWMPSRNTICSVQDRSAGLVASL